MGSAMLLSAAANRVCLLFFVQIRASPFVSLSSLIENCWRPRICDSDFEANKTKEPEPVRCFKVAEQSAARIDFFSTQESSEVVGSVDSTTESLTLLGKGAST